MDGTVSVPSFSVDFVLACLPGSGFVDLSSQELTATSKTSDGNCDFSFLGNFSID